MGFCGALDPALEPGDVVVASEVRGAVDAPFKCDHLGGIAAALARAGVSARQGPIVSVPKLSRGAERARLAESGAIAVDMESAWLAAAANGRPFAVLRAVVDTPSRELVSVATLSGGLKAYRALRRAAGALETWMDTLPDDKET